MAATASTPKAATILDHLRVAPPSTADSTTEQRLPLSFFDMMYVHFHPFHRVLLYQFPCSRSRFLQTIVPNLKNSLSETLKHYVPLAGSLLYPLDSASGIPEFCYFPGDSVSVTIAESSQASDINYLTGNGYRDAAEFYPFVPGLPEPRIDSDSGFKMVPLLAVQITLFPDSGICIGLSNHHVIGDASSTVGFIRFWSSVARLGGDNELLDSSPFFDRSLIKDPSGIANIFWNENEFFRNLPHRSNPYTNKVRATYVLHKDDIQKLKNSALSKNPALLHLSSYTVTAAYVWTCLVKSAAKTGEEVDPNEPEYFIFSADARPRLNPPLPANYFGNCLAFMRTESAHQLLKGNDGFFRAVELIGDVISKKVNNSDEILRGAESWVTGFISLIGKRVLAVSGSPKFDDYDADFGWGKPKKFESLSIDMDGAMALCKSRDFEGGLEIGLSLAKEKMDAFAAIFYDGLKI